jgi:hypothetical protein
VSEISRRGSAKKMPGRVDARRRQKDLLHDKFKPADRRP